MTSVKSSAKKTQKYCDCVAKVNANFEKQGINTRVDSVDLCNVKTGEPTGSIARIAVYKANKRDRRPLSFVRPIYCPFCGKKFDGK